MVAGEGHQEITETQEEIRKAKPQKTSTSQYGIITSFSVTEKKDDAVSKSDRRDIVHAVSLPTTCKACKKDDGHPFTNEKGQCAHLYHHEYMDLGKEFKREVQNAKNMKLHHT